jgi:integrase
VHSAWRIENEAAKLKGAWVDPAAGRVKLGEWAERWYATTAALAPSTRRDYRKSLDLDVLPAFRDAALAEIDALAVREWLAVLAAGNPGVDPPRRPLGAKRRAKARAVLSMVLGSAVDGGKLARNVAKEVKAPKGRRREMHFLDARQVEALAAAVDPRYRALVLFAAYTGVRPSELVALRSGRLDVLKGTARICEAAPEVDGKLEWGGTKTDEARTVHLPRSVAEEVGAMLAGRAGLGPDALVFTAPLGGPLRFSKWIDATFKPALRAAGLPETVRLYDLRHTCASLLKTPASHYRR